MTPLGCDFDPLAEAYPVHARREAPATRPPKRESPRFGKRRKSSGVAGAHQRCNKRSGL